MTARPVLGIIACTRTIGTEPTQAVIDRYMRGTMRYADCAALIIPSLPDLMDAAEVIDRVDGLLLTGSPSNVAPALYGDKGAGSAPFDPARDSTTMRLIDLAAAHSKPLFGICRGFQEINVALGGSLRRDVSENPALLRHHASDDVPFDAMFDHRHPVALTPGGILARAFGRDMLSVNSVHFQGVGQIAPSLAVEATAPDGIIESFSATLGRAPMLAVQWHPEWQTDRHPDSQTYFRLLGRALRGEMAL